MWQNPKCQIPWEVCQLSDSHFLHGSMSFSLSCMLSQKLSIYPLASHMGPTRTHVSPKGHNLKRFFILQPWVLKIYKKIKPHECKTKILCVPFQCCVQSPCMQCHFMSMLLHHGDLFPQCTLLHLSWAARLIPTIYPHA